MKFSILLVSIFMLSTAPALVKMITLDPLVGLSWRLTLACLVLFPFAFSSLHKLNRFTIAKICLVSTILFLHFWTWFYGVRLLNVSYTATIFAANPVFAAILGKWILKEKFRARYALAFCASFLGISYAFLSGRAEVAGSFSILGSVMVFISAFFYALYMVLSKKMRGSLSNSVYTFTLNALAAVIGWSCVGISFVLSGGEGVGRIIPDLEQWKFLVGLVIGPSILGHTLMIYSLPSFNINFVSVLKLLSPISASLIGLFFFSEVLDRKLIIGFFLVLSGVLLAIPFKREKV